MKANGNIFDWHDLNRWVAIFLLFFQSIFLNVIVPGHTRGIITLAGKNSVACPADLGCPLCCESDSSPSKKSRRNVPSDKDRSECAICHLAATVTLPPAKVHALRLLCRAELTDLREPVLFHPSRCQRVHHERGPPVIA